MNQFRVSTLPFSAFALDRFLGGLVEIGISSIELGKTHFQSLDKQTAASLQSETGLRFKSILTTEDIAGPNGLREQIAILDTAQKLSIPMVCVSSGGREDATEAEIELIIDRLTTLTQEAERRSLTLAFYPHHGWMAYNLERTERIFNAIPSGSFKFYYCSYHFQRAGDDPVVALERLADRLCSVYFDCGVDPGTGETPLWAPETDYRAVFRAIRRTGYSDEIMLIYLGLKVESPDPIIEGIVRARALLNELME